VGLVIAAFAAARPLNSPVGTSGDRRALAKVGTLRTFVERGARAAKQGDAWGDILGAVEMALMPCPLLGAGISAISALARNAPARRDKFAASGRRTL
jgi:hypothetical protein